MKYDLDLVIIGGGSAGMVAAELAGRLGIRALLVERHRISGDCLWTGCVPSKALIASARVAQAVRTADRFGIGAQPPEVDTANVWGRLRRIQQEIATTDDDPDRYRILGVEIVFADASFEGDHLIRLNDRAVRTRFALVCTGSRPAAPTIPGLEEAGYLTSETLFELMAAPGSLLIIGGGPIGIEMAQAMARLGVPTEVLQSGPRILPRDEPELAQILTNKLREEGVGFEFGVRLAGCQQTGGKKVLVGRVGDQPRLWSAEEILVATGRRPNIESLGLERAGIQEGPTGIVVDRKLRTSARWVYAAGDCVGRYRFTHSAAAEAVTAIRNMFFPGSSPAPDVVPWTTFTEPELAHVGLTAEEATQKLGADNVRVFRWELRTQTKRGLTARRKER